MDVLIALLLCVAASLPPATSSMKHSTWKPSYHIHHREGDHPYLYSHTHLQEDGVYDHMSGGLTSHLQPRSYSERMVEEGEFILSSMDAHDKRDLHALLSFRKAITSDPLGKLSNWTVENYENICSWYGIRCRKRTKRVVAIDLHAEVVEEDFVRSLEGTLPSSLGNLTLMRTLNLSGNSLTGRIPPQFGHLKALQVLDLSYNYGIQGSIPVELGLLQKLRCLDLSGNRLTGRIPSVFGRLKALQVLDLSYNYGIEGSIPVELGLLQKLESLLLEGNELSGNIPHQLGNLTQLTQLSIAGPNISDFVPLEIFKLPLSYLSLSFNLTRSILKDIANMTTLTQLAI